MKSQVISQLELAMCIYRDAMAKCTAAQPSLRDEMTISSRVEHEGLAFLTLTLPQFGKDFERSLSLGHIDSTAFRSFKKVGAIPAFMQGMLSHVFDRETGRILNEESLEISCVEGIRQVAYAFKKLEMDCTPNRVRSALTNFVQTEHELDASQLQKCDVDAFVHVATVLWDCLFDVDVRQLIPKHGPGATAERVSGNQKYSWQFWHDRLEPYFPFLENAYSISAYRSREFHDVKVVTAEFEKPVKVTCVPKTQKGPRIIAIEPCCMQFVQQGIRKELYALLEKSELSRGHVNFTDQGINRQLAMSSSQDGRLATIDLSDASDRVLFDLAIRMFDCNPDLRDAIIACRSTRAKIPDGPIVGPLRKFASMGSALCFPVESMYFYTICVVALLKGQNRPVTRSEVYRVSRDVYVYGDDILIPHEWAGVVVEHLQKYQCKVNISKSFWTGRFRESCGMDAYGGVEVTPTYIRKLRPDNKRQASEVISWVKTANLFAKRGYRETSSYMFNVCEKIIGDLPVVDEESSALGRIRQYHSGSVSFEKRRWNQKYHASEIYAWVAEPVYRTDELDGYGALQKSLLSLAAKEDYNPFEQLGLSAIIASPSLPKFDEDDEDTWAKPEESLKRSARHGAVTLKRRWVMAS